VRRPTRPTDRPSGKPVRAARARISRIIVAVFLFQVSSKARPARPPSFAALSFLEIETSSGFDPFFSFLEGMQKWQQEL
jgi:hypothetical protein